MTEKGFGEAGESKRQEKGLIKKLLFVVAKIVRIFESLCESSFHIINYMQIYGVILPTFQTDFILGGSKITTDGDCSHEIKRCLLLGRKAMTNLDSMLKSRDITLP